MFWAKIWKISDFLSENFHFLVVKFSVYLNRHVFHNGFGFLPDIPICNSEFDQIQTRLFKYKENFTMKTWKLSDKNSDIYQSSAQNIDCGYLLELPQRGSSNEYQQSMFFSRNKKNNAYPCKPQFYYIKVGFKGVKLYIYIYVYVFVMKFKLTLPLFSDFWLA